MNVLSLQIMLNEKSLIIKLFSLKIGCKQNQDTEVNWKIFTSKEGKRRLSKSEIVLIFRAKHENEVEAQRSEKLLIKQKCKSLFTWLCRRRSLLHPNTAQGSFFPLQSYSKKTLRKNVPKTLENTNEMRSCPLGIL